MSVHLIDGDDLEKLRGIASRLQGGSDRERDEGHKLWLIVRVVDHLRLDDEDERLLQTAPTDAQLTVLAMEHGYGTWRDEAQTDPLWFDGSPLSLLRAALELRTEPPTGAPR